MVTILFIISNSSRLIQRTILFLTLFPTRISFLSHLFQSLFIPSNSYSILIHAFLYYPFCNNISFTNLPLSSICYFKPFFPSYIKVNSSSNVISLFIFSHLSIYFLPFFSFSLVLLSHLSISFLYLFFSFTLLLFSFIC